MRHYFPLNELLFPIIPSSDFVASPAFIQTREFPSYFLHSRTNLEAFLCKDGLHRLTTDLAKNLRSKSAPTGKVGMVFLPGPAQASHEKMGWTPPHSLGLLVGRSGSVGQAKPRNITSGSSGWENSSTPRSKSVDDNLCS